MSNFENRRMPPGDPTPVAGGRDPAERLEKLRQTAKLRTGDELTDVIQRLTSAHPDLVFEFRNPELANMDEETKRLLIKNMRQLLNIYPKEQ